mgnify:FL=1
MNYSPFKFFSSKLNLKLRSKYTLSRAYSTQLSEATASRFLQGCLILSIVLGVGLRFLWIGKREFWYDEVLSVLLSTGQKSAYQLPENVPFSLSDLASVLKIPPENGLLYALQTVKALLKGNLSEPHPPLLYLAEHGWMRLFGNSEIATRSLVMLASLVTLTVAYFLGRRILGQRGGLIFTALLALNPFFLSHSLNLRMYSPLALWACLSALCLMILMNVDRSASTASTASLATSERAANRLGGWRLWLLRGTVALALTAGLMTQYLFGYWFFALAAAVLFLDRKHWFMHALTLGSGAVLFMPWALWGTLKQLSNRRDVLERISANGGFLNSMAQHGRDFSQTLANYLLLGHLTTGMEPMAEPIKPMAVAIGWGVFGFVLMCAVNLYRRRQYWVLVTCGLLGLFPLLLALGVDVVANKNTLGFGWGRATIVVLPGCVLFVAAWLEKATGRWQALLTMGLLAVYLAVNVGDFVGRDRQMFHQVNAALLSGADLSGTDLLGTDLSSTELTLVVMNSRAWGHVNRLTYYLDEQANPDVLAAAPAEITAALEQALNKKNYARVLWLQANYPLWDKPETEAEARTFITATDELLQSRYQLMAQQSLRGTMNLDSFELQVYQRPAA